MSDVVDAESAEAILPWIKKIFLGVAKPRGATIHPGAATTSYLRDVVSARVENTSLRTVAREIGMSPGGLKKFLEGTSPYAPTLRRLRSWYVQQAALQRGGLAAQDASTALALLLRDLQPDSQREVALLVLRTLCRGYDDSGKPRPAWLLETVASYEELGEQAAFSARPSALGKYAHIAGTSDDFALRKQEEIDVEDRRGR